MKNFDERSLDESNTVGRAKKSQGWIILALVVTLCIIFIIQGILTGLLFGNYSTVNDDLSVLKYNVSDPAMKNDVSELWKSVLNILGDLSKLKDKVDITGGSCTTCPFGWKMIRSNCYFFSSLLETWKRSKELCAGRNGILVVIKDEFEMMSLLPIIAQKNYWIGLKRDPNNITMWMWTDGSPLTYSVWNEGEPSNAYNNEHCAEVIGKVQLWNDLKCDQRRYYLCKGVWDC
ncbi:C-type lectin-like [Dendropsophus ebraccatus]|uniref:C-type lectin-like n=1 Tax=Dendropsophus ebraccatus TaxID=150705 RepID=UPI00383216F0